MQQRVSADSVEISQERTQSGNEKDGRSSIGGELAFMVAFRYEFLACRKQVFGGIEMDKIGSVYMGNDDMLCEHRETRSFRCLNRI